MQHKLLILTLALFCLIIGAPFASAQEKKIEINGVVGYTLSEGVDIDPYDFEGDMIRRISPKSAFSYGLGLDYYVDENFSVGFNFNQEQSKLNGNIQGGGEIDVTDMDVNNYHGIFTYVAGDEDEMVRPYIFGGLGATQYDPGNVDGRDTSSKTKFSTTWGGGVRVYTSEHFGFRGGVRWTPTYIKSDPAGIWCDPWWPGGCWVMSNANYSHQFELSGGFSLRF